MNHRKYFFESLFIAASLMLVTTVSVAKEWHATNLVQEGISKCDTGSWSYHMTWKPAKYENKPVLKYIVKGNGCTASDYSCTAEKCLAKLSGCTTRLSTSWTGVTADIGSVSGVRSKKSAVRPGNCR